MSKVDDVERVARQHGEATFRLALSRAVGMPMGTSDQVLLDEARIAVLTVRQVGMLLDEAGVDRVVATTEKDHNGDIIETELELEDRVRVLLDKWCSNVVLAKQAERIARIEELCEQLRRMWV